jgi:hypothetical protein
MPKEKEFGEGNYKAAREYDAGATAHARNKAKVEREAKDAADALDSEEGSELAKAEAKGKSHARH